MHATESDFKSVPCSIDQGFSQTVSMWTSTGTRRQSCNSWEEMQVAEDAPEVVLFDEPALAAAQQWMHELLAKAAKAPPNDVFKLFKREMTVSQSPHVARFPVPKSKESFEKT